MTAKIILKKGREKSLLRRHPWIFSGAVEKIEGSYTNVVGFPVELVKEMMKDLGGGND